MITKKNKGKDNKIIFKLKNESEVLSSRIHGKEIYKKAEKENFFVVFDFEGVRVMNSAFADELFGKIIEKIEKENKDKSKKEIQQILPQTFKIKNIENNMIKKIIVYVMDGRRY